MQGILIAAALAALLSVICLIMLIITNSKLTALKNDNNSSELSARVEQIKSSVETAERIQREELNRTTRDTMLSLGESMASRLSLAMEAQGESTEKLLQVSHCIGHIPKVITCLMKLDTNLGQGIHNIR